LIDASPRIDRCYQFGKKISHMNNKNKNTGIPTPIIIIITNMNIIINNGLIVDAAAKLVKIKRILVLSL